MLWSKGCNCYTRNAPILWCSSWHAFNPCALIQNWIFFHLNLIVGVNFFSTLNSYLKCYLLGLYPYAFCNSSNKIPIHIVHCLQFLTSKTVGEDQLNSHPFYWLYHHINPAIMKYHLNAVLWVDLTSILCLPLLYGMKIILCSLMLIV